LRRAYWVAQGGTALAIGASIVLAVWSSLALDLTRGLMLGLPALFVSVLLQWIWAGRTNNSLGTLRGAVASLPPSTW
jgi:hypothetical protein